MRFCGQWISKNQNWLKWLVAVGILGFLFTKHGESFRQFEWSRVNPWGFLGAIGLCFFAQVVTYSRWFLLVWAQDLPFSWRDAIRLGFIGYVFNYIAPGAVGGDVVKASLLVKQQPERRLVALATVLLDRIVGLVGLLIVGAAAMSMATPLRDHPQFKYIANTIVWVGIGLSVGILLILHPWTTHDIWVRRLVELPKIGRLFGGVINAVRLYQARWKVVILVILLSCFAHVVTIASVYLAAASVQGIDMIPSFAMHLQLSPPAQLVGVIIPLPGGVGAMEGAMAYLYGLAGSTDSIGFLSGIAYRIVTICVAAIGGVWYFVSRGELPTPQTTPAEAQYADQ
ncbi:lysylphosphatidylglycerol synthase transmembrane domain-containing protein [Thalassoroseus pseudoceratinae]|uniref:lysylphosphatidylglycerol synthase transmembrane domain-containing protein n=1 Tax=Thalassoroseus pseudoceratinae TaxID=2713176 RepID=UPI001420D5F1|nr:lysylphosphatidylglycerol synthase transmembrane domain-containing protein [Thalassoroseus pseudoceratinae]